MPRSAVSRWALLVALMAGATGVVAEEVPWQRVTGPPILEFPHDHGAHPDFRTEWWYATGQVEARDGRRFGIQITFFRRGLEAGEAKPANSRLRARQIVAAHVAVADLSTGRFLHAERIRRTAGGLAGAATGDLRVWIDDWEMSRQGDGSITIDAHDAESGIGLALELKPERSLVRHGDQGYSRKGAEDGNASVYLSWTRAAVAGEIEVDGSRSSVQGGAWFDHEWGTSTLGVGVEGWDWFSLRLDDGRDLMVYRLRRRVGADDPRSSGTLVLASGEVVHLSHDETIVEVLERWQSPQSGADYPVRWHLRIPSQGIDLEVRALLASSELDGTATTGVVYWEGPVESSGSAKGEGYVEMTGYAGTLEERF